ncbi:LpqB family beta-propeller domain-containing protein [Plantactinospora sp. KBS50]|uniref:LpqB family beta-propeller domain-containing protein n=1 Tax=Plantactinospora sp. KBS50 TaxID=2024580 RepID=UPI000BAAFF7C|nr:LpqB family beta-propeller domain-containing protein [Plantactinospora sp. KBS50]ASW53734.1 hypothetical protein CIK06_05295 [Plantactinospora sp. KBS50]
MSRRRTAAPAVLRGGPPRRRLTLLVVLAAVLSLGAGLAGCGIPKSTAVRVDGRGPSPFTGSAGGDGREPPAPGETTEPAQFVKNFLQAPAGEADGAYDRVNAYLSNSARLQRKPSGDVQITIVQPTATAFTDVQSAENGSARVRVPVKPVGVLNADGTLAPPPAGAPTSYTFDVVRIAPDEPSRPEAGRLEIANQQAGLLMSTEALKDFYRSWIVYFWSTDGAVLVPDQRYLPLAVPRERWATEVAGWLNDGPAAWLRPATQPLPDGLRLTGNVAETDGLLSINVSASTGADARDGQFERLETQLAWSMRDVNAPRFELRLRNSSRPPVVAEDARRQAPLYALTGHEQRFCVYDGQVRALVGAPAEQALSAVPIHPEQNRDVDSAGMLRSGGRVAVALVTGSGGRYRLLTGLGQGEVELTHTSKDSYASMGQPVWLKGLDPQHPTGFVVAAGQLYRFDGGAQLTAIRVPATSGAVKAVAAALDGRRLAVVAGDQVYVVPLSIDGGTVTLGDARQVPITLGSPTALDWVSERDLMVAGTRAGQAGVVDQLSIDGALTSQQFTAGSTITRLSGYPDNPMIQSLVSRYMYEVDGQGWANRFSSNVRIPTADVVGGEVEGAVPRAPFFLY